MRVPHLTRTLAAGPAGAQNACRAAADMGAAIVRRQLQAGDGREHRAAEGAKLSYTSLRGPSAKNMPQSHNKCLHSLAPGLRVLPHGPCRQMSSLLTEGSLRSSFVRRSPSQDCTLVIMIGRKKLS